MELFYSLIACKTLLKASVTDTRQTPSVGRYCTMYHAVSTNYRHLEENKGTTFSVNCWDNPWGCSTFEGFCVGRELPARFIDRIE